MKNYDKINLDITTNIYVELVKYKKLGYKIRSGNIDLHTIELEEKY